MAASGTELPRNFKLLEEYDNAIGKERKSLITGRHAGLIDYGLEEEKDDNLLHYWRAIIIGPQETHIGEFIYNLKIFVSDKYPAEAPEIRFVEPKIAMPAVGADGKVNLSKLEPRFVWSREKNIADCLMAIRDNMYNEKVWKPSGSLANTSY